MKEQPTTSKHSEISQTLRLEIAAGTYGGSQRIPSEAQLVKRFGVSRPTVARALRDLQAEGLIERRAGSGSFVRASRPNTAETRILGLLVPGRGTTEIFDLICGELGGLARAHNYGMLWGGSPHPRGDNVADEKHAEEACCQFVERSVSGVFFAPFEFTPAKDAINGRLAGMLQTAGIPVVLLDRDLVPFPSRSEFDLVGMDNFGAGFLLADHLIKLGCRQLRFVVRRGSAPTVDARIAGAREAILRHNVQPASGWVAQGDPTDREFVKSLAPGRNCDAILCANDFTAAQLLRTLDALRVQVPKQVRVVGFDDVRYATLLSIPLTTIHQPCREIAAVAFRALLDRIQDATIPPRTLTLTPRLVVRESCGAYSNR